MNSKSSSQGNTEAKVDGTDEITQWLTNWETGNTSQLDKLPKAIHNEIRRLAVQRLSKERRNHTLQPTALVNEVFLRLMGRPHTRFEGKSHFIKLVARMMRNILVDYSRMRKARGGNSLSQFIEGINPPAEELALEDTVSLNLALERLTILDAHLGELVELRFFMGLSVEQIAEVFGTSKSTVERDWRTARAFLKSELAGGGM